MDFTILAGHRVKMKGSKKRDKYLDLTRELKKLEHETDRFVIDVLITVTKGLVQGLEDLEISGRMETMQTIALLRSARLLRRVLET